MGDENDADYVYDQMTVYLCPSWALSLGYMGVAAGAVLSNWGSAVSCLFTYIGESFQIFMLCWQSFYCMGSLGNIMLGRS